LQKLFTHLSNLRKFAYLSLVVVSLLAYSGCASNNSLTRYDKDTSVPAAQTSAPDLQPVISEPEIALEQELKALASSGTWEPPQVPPVKIIVQPEPITPEPLYDFPVVMNRQVELYLDLFQNKQRKYFARWLARSGRYKDMIHAELEAAGMPKDLIYLALIESGFNQRAYSKSKAVGLWQFMSSTGREYGLSITRYVDERRDAEKSTRAAVAFLKDLYQEFDDWYLAVAAYNGGPGTIRKAISRTNSNDFWKIAQKKHLRMETKRYVPKLIATIMIAKEPEKYGFGDIVYDPPLTYDTIEVGPGLTLSAAAMLTGSNQKEIALLNQELRSTKTPLDSQQYILKIPTGTKTLAQNNLPRLHSVVQTDYKTHVVKRNETLAKICRLYNINTTTLLKVNNLTSSTLKTGTRLRIPYQTIAYRILPEGMDAITAAKDDLILHTVKKGETISAISHRYQIPPELIVAWNGLPSVHKITAGQQLALFMSTSSPAPSTQQTTVASSTADSSLMVLSDSKKRKTETIQKRDLFTWYLVRNGDSLWTISRKFNTSPDHIKRWNNLKSNLIHPGSKLKLKDV